MTLYVDDTRDPKGDFDYVARSSKGAIYIMNLDGCPNFVSFDHDLGGVDTAMIVIKWMVNRDLDCGGKFIPANFEFNVHSANPVGAANITGYLNSYLKQKGQK